MNTYSCIIIDDEEIAIKRLTLMIENHIEGLKVVAVYCNATDALNDLPNRKPDIVFTDVKMPGMNGIEFVELLNKSKIKIQPILMSGYKQPDIFLNAIKLNIVDFIEKPYVESEIRQAFEKAKQRIETNKHLDIMPKLLQIMKDDEKIQFKTLNGIIVERRGDILGLESDGKMSDLFSLYWDKRRINEAFVDIQDRIINTQFLRIGRSHIINLKYISEINTKTKKCHLRYNDKTISFNLSEQACKDVLDEYHLFLTRESM
ncbi:MAG TPA: response regulator [Chitinophagaceae bacterium]|nr:response regulator [Chitinophagaceae bacterium]